MDLQADNDHHVKDTYNYATVQADVKMPGRHFRYLEDDTRAAAFGKAICAAVDRVHAEDKDARVLNLGCGAGLQYPFLICGQLCRTDAASSEPESERNLSLALA